MAHPRISICLITARPGGIDVLLTGLSRQDFDDFEVILVDALYHHRNELVADLFSTAKIRFIHTPPRQRIWPYDACPQARNMAIAKARGELLLWLVDYSFVPHRCLNEHWGVWLYTNKKKAGMGAHKYLYPPETAYDLPDYAPLKMFKPNEANGITYAYDPVASERFAKDVDIGFYDPYMYSVFKTPITTVDQIEQLSEDPHFWNADPKLAGLVGGTVSGNFYHGKGETTPLNLMLQANGFDECFRGHLYDDTDMGHRLGHAGAEWMLLDPIGTIQIINPRHLFPHLLRFETIDRYRDVYDARRTDLSVIRANNPYDLDQWRDAVWWY